MLWCLTKSKIDCSFQNNEFRFKNRGFTQFFWGGFLSFFSFLRSTLDEITKRYVKNYGFFFGKKREKKKKKHSSYGRKKIKKKKKARTGFEPAIFGSTGEGSNPPYVRDRRLTTWPPSRSLNSREKLKSLNLVPKILTINTKITSTESDNHHT